jgi:hypothetical protein
MDRDIITYANLIHRHGLGSKEAEEFKASHADPVFRKRAKVLERLFVNRKRVLEEMAASDAAEAGHATAEPQPAATTPAPTRAAETIHSS